MAFKDRLYDVPVVGTALRVQDRYQADAGDQFAGAIGFFGFLSLFPLVLLALSVVGFVLADASPDEMADVSARVQDAIQSAIPGLSGSQAVDDALANVVDNAGATGIVGGVLLLLAGLRVVNSAQTATLVIFGVDRSQMTGVKQKVRQVGAMVALGLLAIAGTAAGSAIGVVTQIEFLGVMDVLAPVLTTVGSFVLDTALFLAAYRLFGTRAGPPVSTLLPGAVLAGAGWTLLKLLGSTYVSSQADSGTDTYGALAGVIGLMLLFYLAGRLFVYGAELSAVRAPNPEDPTEAPEEVGMESRVDEDDQAAAAATAGGPPAAAGTPLATARVVGRRPPPGTSTAEAALLAPAASEATRARLMTRPEPPREAHGRQALAFALAVGAVAGLVGALRPWDHE